MEIILDEERYAESILKNGVINDKIPNILNILAKYYYHVFGYRKKKIQKLLTEFMELNYNNYCLNKVQWDETIEKIAAKTGKSRLFKSAGVCITKPEMHVITSIRDEKLERIYFALMCIAKLWNQKKENNNGWVNLDLKSVFELARVNAKRRERNFKINDLYAKNLIDLPKNITNTSIKVLEINENGDEELFVSDFRELGYEYLKYKGQNFIRCANCGILTRGNKRDTKKYCNACAGYLKKGLKTVICVDCGKEFKVDSRNMKKIRCDKCQEKYRKKIVNENAKKYYILKKKQ